MNQMFYKARAFNQDITAWDVSKVTDFYFMFAYANAFNQNIGATWAAPVADYMFMLTESGLNENCAFVSEFCRFAPSISAFVHPLGWYGPDTDPHVVDRILRYEFAEGCEVPDLPCPDP
jgi:surface protein